MAVLLPNPASKGKARRAALIRTATKKLPARGALCSLSLHPYSHLCSLGGCGRTAVYLGNAPQPHSSSQLHSAIPSAWLIPHCCRPWGQEAPRGQRGRAGRGQTHGSMSLLALHGPTGAQAQHCCEWM